MAKKHKDSFTTIGFNNWKKAVERFLCHQESEYHKEAEMKFKSFATIKRIRSVGSTSRQREGRKAKYAAETAV